MSELISLIWKRGKGRVKGEGGRGEGRGGAGEGEGREVTQS
jgi:hypothetical protein